MELELITTIFKIHEIMDFIDDGYHNKDICNLIKVSNELFDKLSPEAQSLIRKTYDEKYDNEEA